MVMNEILCGLYLGSYSDAKDYNQLHKNKIQSIVSVMSRTKEIFPEKKYLALQVRDSREQNLMQYFGVCNRFIHKSRLNGENVLVHCAVGRSRSVTITAAYIMAVANLNVFEALHYIRLKRSIAQPNRSFQVQLHQYQWGLLPLERFTLHKKLQCQDTTHVQQFLRFQYKNEYYAAPEGKAEQIDLEVYNAEHENEHDMMNKHLSKMGFIRVMPYVYSYSPPHMSESYTHEIGMDIDDDDDSSEDAIDVEVLH